MHVIKGSIQIQLNNYMDNQLSSNVPTKNNGLCVAAFVIGLIFIVLSFVPGLGYGAIVSLILGLVGLKSAAKKSEKKGLGLTGIILSILALIITTVMLISAAIVINAELESPEGKKAIAEIKNAWNEAKAAATATPATPVSAASEAPAAAVVEEVIAPTESVDEVDEEEEEEVEE